MLEVSWKSLKASPLWEPLRILLVGRQSPPVCLVSGVGDSNGPSEAPGLLNPHSREFIPDPLQCEQGVILEHFLPALFILFPQQLLDPCTLWSLGGVWCSSPSGWLLQ